MISMLFQRFISHD